MCDHGEPRGPRYCAFCRRNGVIHKEYGQKVALQAVDDGWRASASQYVLFLAAQGIEFTVDDIVGKVGLPNDSEVNANNAVGALLSGFARKGVIKGVGYTNASREGSHGRAVRVWVGR